MILVYRSKEDTVSTGGLTILFRSSRSPSDPSPSVGTFYFLLCRLDPSLSDPSVLSTLS